MRIQLLKKILQGIFFFASSFCFAVGHTVSITGVDVSCYGLCNGYAFAIVDGGSGPFTYSWSPTGGSSDIGTGFCPGTYTCTVTDQSDMSTAIATVVISQPSAPLDVSVITINATCNSMCNGSATAT